MRLKLPSLKERRCDIPLLVEHFRNRLNAETGKNIKYIDPGVYDVLMRHDFPGNVRELENIMQHAFVLCRGNTIQRQHLPEEFTVELHATTDEKSSPMTLQNIEKQAIREALKNNAGNKSQAARQLGINPSTLYRKMYRYGIEDS